jgi:hypothetical protein
MFYLCFASASKVFVDWLQESIQHNLSVRGHVTSAKKSLYYPVRYAKSDSLKILRRMYRDAPKGTYLSRKHLKIQKMLAIVGERL